VGALLLILYFMANESIGVLKDKKYSFPKKGQVRIYRLLGLHKDSVNGNFVCPQTRTIPNKFLLNDTGTPKSYVYVSHQDPSIQSNNVPVSQRGKIVFTREARGEIIINGERMDHKLLDEALFFHQQNLSNAEKDWHIKPRTGEYLFELVDYRKKAEVNVHEIERNNDCNSIIKAMTVANSRDTYEMVFKMQSEGLTHSEVKSALYKHVAVAENAKAFIILDKSEQMAIKKIINLAYDGKIIEKAANGTGVVWTQGKELLCNKLPKRSLEQSLITYLITDEGQDVLNTLKELTEPKK